MGHTNPSEFSAFVIEFGQILLSIYLQFRQHGELMIRALYYEIDQHTQRNGPAAGRIILWQWRRCEPAVAGRRHILYAF